MLVMAGASASGKTEIAKIIIQKYGFKKMITYTTRNKRDGECNGIDYHFISLESFLELKKNDFFIETTLYNGNYYGTAFQDTSFDKVLIVDTNGANILYECLKSKVTIFFLEAPDDIRRDRMRKRGDQEEDIEHRIHEDATYFLKENLHHIDYIIATHHEGLESLADRIYKLYINHVVK
ncbi:MAG: AAA family ATPase [Bacilli bacterium]